MIKIYLFLNVISFSSAKIYKSIIQRNNNWEISNFQNNDISFIRDEGKVYKVKLRIGHALK